MSGTVTDPHDGPAADAAARALGTGTRQGAADTAGRAAALTRLRAAAAAGAFDLRVFEDKGTCRR